MVSNLSYDFALIKKKTHAATDWVVYQAILGDQEDC